MFGDKRRPPATIAAEIDRIIGLNIRRAREDARLGQHEVATLLGISVHVLARYEEGQERAPASVLLELTRHVGCQLTELFAGMPSMDADGDFQGSRPAAVPFAEVVAPRQPVGHSRPEAGAVGGTPIPTKNDAVAVADIIRAFSDLTSPAVRENLLGLLRALA